LQNNIKKILYP